MPNSCFQKQHEYKRVPLDCILVVSEDRTGQAMGCPKCNKKNTADIVWHIILIPTLDDHKLRGHIADMSIWVWHTDIYSQSPGNIINYGNSILQIEIVLLESVITTSYTRFIHKLWMSPFDTIVADVAADLQYLNKNRLIVRETEISYSTVHILSNIQHSRESRSKTNKMTDNCQSATQLPLWPQMHSRQLITKQRNDLQLPSQCL